MRAGTVLLAMLIGFAAPALAEMFGPKEMHNLGLHVGHVTWAINACNARPTQMYSHMSKLGAARYPEHFKKGVRAGLVDAGRAEQHGRDVACMTSRLLYGPNGTHVQGLVH